MLHINTSKIFFPCSLQWTRSSGNGSENSLIIGSSWALKYTTVQPVHNTNNLVWINQERQHRLTWTQALFDKDFAVDLVNQINLQSPLNSRQSEIPHPGRLSRAPKLQSGIDYNDSWDDLWMMGKPAHRSQWYYWIILERWDFRVMMKEDDIVLLLEPQHWKLTENILYHQTTSYLILRRRPSLWKIQRQYILFKCN